jgi:AcrR family transcriptional regulator
LSLGDNAVPVASIDAIQRAATPIAADARVLAAVRSCVERWGVAKTTLDDVAKAAGVSRATLYRLFPGGKDSAIAALGQFEIATFFAHLDEVVTPLDSLEERIVAALETTFTYVDSHAALQYLIAHEPGLVFAGLTFGRLNELLDRVGGAAAHWLEPFVGAEEAPRAAEWIARVAVSYLMSSSQWVRLDDHESVTTFVRTFLIPGLERVASSRGVPTVRHSLS